MVSFQYVSRSLNMFKLKDVVQKSLSKIFTFNPSFAVWQKDFVILR